MSAWPVTGETRFLIAAALHADRGIEGQRAVEDAAGDLAAVGHLAQRRRVEGGRDLGVDGFDGREQRDLGLGNAERVGQVDGVLHDVNLVFEFRLDVDGGVGDEQGARVGRRIHDEDVGDAARRCAGRCRAAMATFISSSVCRLPFIMAWALPLRHMATLISAALASVSAWRIGYGDDVDADFGGQSVHFGFIADERGLDEAFGSGFNGAAQSDVGQRPADRGGDGGQGLAALKELVKDVIVGGMADQRVDGNGFGKGGKIAHVFILHGRRGMNPSGLTLSFLRGPGKWGVRKVTLRLEVAQCGTPLPIRGVRGKTTAVPSLRMPH